MPMTRAADRHAAGRQPLLLPADWPAPPGVRAFTTLRHGGGASQAPFDSFNLGLRSGDEADVVLGNRALLIAQAGLPGAPHWLRQVHGVAVCRFGPDPGSSAAQDTGAVSVLGQVMPGAAPASGQVGGGPGAPDRAAGQAPDAAEPEADAAVTSAPGTVLAILTADCLPVVFAARDGREVGAAHAGWRGLAAGVLERTVSAMRTPPHALQAWLGPAAGPQAYEVGDEVRAAFVDRDAHAAAAFTATRPGHWRVDLYALARQRLAAAGLAAADIHGGGLCTISDRQRFYSHRRDARTGRMATVVWRAPAWAP